MIERALKQVGLINAEYAPPPADSDEVFRQWEQAWREDALRQRDHLLQSPVLAALAATGPAPEEDKLAQLVARYRRYLEQINALDDAFEITRLLKDCHATGAVGAKGSAKAWGGKDAKKRGRGLSASIARSHRQRSQGNRSPARRPRPRYCGIPAALA